MDYLTAVKYAMDNAAAVIYCAADPLHGMRWIRTVNIGRFIGCSRRTSSGVFMDDKRVDPCDLMKYTFGEWENHSCTIGRSFSEALNVAMSHLENKPVQVSIARLTWPSPDALVFGIETEGVAPYARGLDTPGGRRLSNEDMVATDWIVNVDTDTPTNVPSRVVLKLHSASISVVYRGVEFVAHNVLAPEDTDDPHITPRNKINIERLFKNQFPDTERTFKASDMFFIQETLDPCAYKFEPFFISSPFNVIPVGDIQNSANVAGTNIMWPLWVFRPSERIMSDTYTQDFFSKSGFSMKTNPVFYYGNPIMRYIGVVGTLPVLLLKNVPKMVEMIISAARNAPSAGGVIIVRLSSATSMADVIVELSESDVKWVKDISEVHVGPYPYLLIDMTR